jgi:Cof subfamily protein (haloacid dehalogenase superfamily)
MTVLLWKKRLPFCPACEPVRRPVKASLREKPYSRICVTDLDGTLLNNEHEISPPNLLALRDLGEMGVCRVAATGRSLYSLRKVLTADVPFDYVIFSTGAGVMNWKTQEIILSRHIDVTMVESTFRKLVKLGEDFMLHAPIPENHRFLAVQGKNLADFNRRISIYQPFSEIWNGVYPLPWQDAAQFLVIADGMDEALCLHLTKLLAPLKVVRTTSPLDHISLWIEIFSPEVSKGSAVQYLMDTLGVESNDLMAVGNDYNDIDMLKLTKRAYVTFNAPAQMKRIYQVVSDYNNHGFAEAVSDWRSSF